MTARRTRSVAATIGSGLIVIAGAALSVASFESMQTSKLATQLEHDADRLLAAGSVVDSALVQSFTAVQVAQTTAAASGGSLSESLASLSVLPDLVSSVTVSDASGTVLGALGAPALLTDASLRFATEAPTEHPTLMGATGDDPVTIGALALGATPGTVVAIEFTIPHNTIREIAGTPASTAYRVSFGDGEFRRTLVAAGSLADGGSADRTLDRTMTFGGRQLALVVGGTDPTPWWASSVVGAGGALISAAILLLARRLIRVTRQIREDAIEHAALELALTERRRGEMQLYSANARAQAVLNCVPDAIVALDGSDGRCTLLNRPRFLGLSNHELASAGFLSIVHENDRQRVRDALHRQDVGGLAVGFRAIDQAGHEHHLLLRTSSVVPGLMSGAPSHVALLTDVTEQHERRDRESALRKAMDEAQHLEALGRLAGGIAHDFGNILSTVRIQAEVLAMMSEEENESALAIVQAVQCAEALVKQLLSFARRDVGEPVDVEVDRSIRNMETLIKSRAGGAVITDLELAAGGRHVLADPSQIDQVLLNLIGNACDAMPDGGALTIRTSVLAAGHPDLGDFDPDHLCIEITDTGSGMTPDVAARVFEPFFTTKGSGGTGLGLATVHSIITAMGGTIAVRSAVGLGTRFVVLLPASDAGALGVERELAGLRAWADSLGEPQPESCPVVYLLETESVDASIDALLLEHGYDVSYTMTDEVDVVVVDARTPELIDPARLRPVLERVRTDDVIVVGLVAQATELGAALRDSVVIPASPFRAEKLLLALAAAVGVAR